jgi:hypothetical protein
VIRRRREGRVFALTLAGGFFFIALVAYWRALETVAIVALSLAVTSLFAALLVPGRLEPVRLGWMKLGEIIGRVTTPILLAIVYYAIVTPIGILRRAAAGTRRTPPDSQWHQRPPSPPPARLERQF